VLCVSTYQQLERRRKGNGVYASEGKEREKKGEEDLSHVKQRLDVDAEL
jgi:hypothetical protein